jgi:hypothetical protein
VDIRAIGGCYHASADAIAPPIRKLRPKIKLTQYPLMTRSGGRRAKPHPDPAAIGNWQLAACAFQPQWSADRAGSQLPIAHCPLTTRSAPPHGLSGMNRHILERKPIAKPSTLPSAVHDKWWKSPV